VFSADNTDNISQVGLVLIRHGRQAETTVADDFGGHTLKDLIIAAGFGYQVGVIVAVGVKKTGAGDQTVGIDYLLGPMGIYATVNFHDLSMVKCNMGSIIGVSRAIYDSGVPNEQIKWIGHGVFSP